MFKICNSELRQDQTNVHTSCKKSDSHMKNEHFLYLANHGND